MRLKSSTRTPVRQKHPTEPIVQYPTLHRRMDRQRRTIQRHLSLLQSLSIGRIQRVEGVNVRASRRVGLGWRLGLGGGASEGRFRRVVVGRKEVGEGELRGVVIHLEEVAGRFGFGRWAMLGLVDCDARGNEGAARSGGGDEGEGGGVGCQCRRQDGAGYWEAHGLDFLRSI